MSTEHEQFEKLLEENHAFVAKMRAHRQCQEKLESVPDESHPVTLGDFELRGEIGRGGMGVVYEAWQKSMDRRVALKVLPGGLLADLKSVARFEREAKVAGKLHHQNVVAVHGMGVDNNTPHYAMEYVEGETLAEINTRVNFAAEAVETPFGRVGELAFYSNLARAFAEVADGLQHAHSKGVIHRDVKPSNLILDRDRLRILDFGLARFEGQESLTLSGDVVGTPPYMSPEQARREKTPIDHRTDVYSLGATLYEALTGRPPFRGKSPVETLSHVIERDPVPPTTISRRTPKDLETIVLQCLRKDTGDRYGTAEALARDLRRFVRGDPIEARPQPAWEQFGRRFWRYRWSIAGAGVATLVTLVGLAIATLVVARARSAAEAERDIARENLYVAEMGLALDAWEHGHIAHLEQLLLAHVPDVDEPELRGWEWYYLDGLRDQAALTLPGHKGWGGRVAFSPQGEFLAAKREETIEIWHPTSRRLVQRLESPGDDIGALAWSPDGLRIAAAGHRGVVTVWDVASAAIVKKFEYPTKDRRPGSGVRALAWSPEGSLLASGGNESVPLVLWDVVDGSRFQTLTDEPADSIAWSPGGEELATVAWTSRPRGTVAFWLRDGTKADGWEFEPGTTSIAWSPDGQTVAVGTAEGALVFFERSTGSELSTLRGHAGEVRSLAWNHEDRIASAGAGGLVKVWEGASRTNIATLRGHRAWVKSVSWSADGRLLASAGDDDTVKVWEPDAAQGVRIVSGRSPAAWSSDGRFIATAGEDGSASVFRSETLELLFTVGKDDVECMSLGWSPDDRYLALARLDGMVEVWDTTTSMQTFRVRSHDVARSVAWSADGYLATGGKDRPPAKQGERVRIWDVASGEEVRALGSAFSVESVVWSPDGRFLAAAEARPPVSVWEVGSGREVHRFQSAAEYSWGQRGQYSLAWSPQGDRLAAGAADGTIFIFSMQTGEQLVRARSHASRVLTVAWSPDGRRLASGGDGAVKIWRVRERELTQLLTLRRHEAPVFSLAWSPDGSRLLSASRLAVVIWDAPGWTD